MEKNNINEVTSTLEDKCNKFIDSIITKFKKYKYIKLFGKILHYLDKPILYYNCTVLTNTKSNPFDIDIDFSFEFIDGEIPYVSILTDFIEPTFNDNRNYFRCLTKDYKYYFSLDDLPKSEIIFETMIEGIENFLTYINESIAINSFIFFGEYEYNHIYQINDFLQNGNYNFYRINEIKKNKYEERYILFTELYFLLFSPTPGDKALVKLLFFQKLKDINLFFDKNDQNNSLILKLNYKKFKYDIEFIMIDRKRKDNLEELSLVEDEHNNTNNDKEKKYDYSMIIKEWFTYADIIKFNQYDLVLNKYKIFFRDNKKNIKIKKTNPEKIKEYNNYIKFNENLISLYQKINSNGNKERIHKLVSNIIYICSELVNFGDSDNGNNNEYILKIRKYISLNKK